MDTSLRAVDPEIHVASPLGFAEPTRMFYAQILLPIVRRHGLLPLDPWAAPFDEIALALHKHDPVRRTLMLKAANARHGAYNEQLIPRAAAVLAILDGPDVDSGTAAEVGFAAALGKPIIGWRSDLRSSGDNEATRVNLQVEHFIRASGGEIFRDAEPAIEALARIAYGGE